MFIAMFEVITICAAIVFTVALGMSMKHTKMIDDDREIAWYLRANRHGRARTSFRSILMSAEKLKDEVAVSEGTYCAGNRLIDDLYIDCSGQRIRLYLNVQKDKVFVSVLKGIISVDQNSYGADPEKRIEIREYATIVVGETQLQFRKER